MKKLLSLLSVLTISGAALPTTIAASPYQKQEQIKLKNIDKRQKRNNNENNKINITKIVIRTNSIIRSAGIILNNKVYFGSSDHNIYEYDPVTQQKRIIFTTGSWNESSGVVLNNKLYFGSADGNIYEYSEYYLNLNLGKINNNSNSAILNELNYLNSDLDVSQLEIITKTNNSASVKIKDNLNNEIINLKYSINNEQNKIINLNELIKKAIFFKYRDENNNLKFKEIKNINTNNLNFSNIEVTKKEKSFLRSININSGICNNEEFINNTTSIKSFDIPACVYNSKYKLTFQILTGLTNKNQEDKINGWNINYDDQMKLTDFINSNYNENTEIISELSDNFDLSNTNKQEQEIIINYFNKQNSKFDLNPNEKLQVNYSALRIITIKNMLNLKQNITGAITAKIVNSYNEEKIITLSIKEAMQILQNYNLLPDEIIINNNGITFNGKASISSEQEGEIKQSVVVSII